MSVLIKNMEMPKGCIYANDNDQTEYCPLLNHDDVPFCQYIESEPEIAIGIGERPVYCPLSDVPEPCENTVSRQAAIDALRDAENHAFNSFYQGLIKAHKIIADLPAVQPQRKTDEWCTDCREYDSEKHCCPRFNRVIRQTLSEQPKIIHCRDCKYADEDIVCQNDKGLAIQDGDDFCSFAEGRIDE